MGIAVEQIDTVRKVLILLSSKKDGVKFENLKVKTFEGRYSLDPLTSDKLYICACTLYFLRVCVCVFWERRGEQRAA